MAEREMKRFFPFSASKVENFFQPKGLIQVERPSWGHVSGVGGAKGQKNS